MKGLLPLGIVCLLLLGCGAQAPQCPDRFSPPSAFCVCNPQRTGVFIVGCFQKSINEAVAAIRREDASFISHISHLSFNGPNETTLASETFTGFTALTILSICCSPSLVNIEPRAFASLSQLETLELQRNRLRYLSGASFAGLGRSLTTLRLDENALVGLNSDLQPIFSSLNSLTMDSNRDFVCDCHLAWFQDFVTNNVSPAVDHSQISCAQPQVGLIANTGLDFDILPCIDLCVSGYHNCAPDATCSLNTNNETVCTCREGFTGSGFICTPLGNPCNMTNECDQNAICTPNFTTQTVTCTCRSGYTGNGIACSALGNPCDTTTECDLNAVCTPNITAQTVTCTCRGGFTGDGATCIQLGDPCNTTTDCDSNAICTSNITAQTVTCTCLEGFTGDGSTCIPLNPCDTTTVCHPNATCTPNVMAQTASCTCLPEFTGDGSTCVPLNPCDTTTMCHPNATCTPNVMSQTASCTCLPGFTGNGFACTPLGNPCATTTRCHANATCTPMSIVAQTVNCTCSAGFTGDGNVCVPLPDPCDSTTRCHSNARCTPNIIAQTVTCTCLESYTGDGTTCNPLGNPCDTTTWCDQNAICTPNILEQTVNCTCREGFTGSGFVCSPLPNPCDTTTQCHPDARCMPDILAQTVTCTCLEGFTGDGFTCTPLPNPCDECHTNATCTMGSLAQTVTCTCLVGFTGDGTDICNPLPNPCDAVNGCHANASCTPNIIAQTVSCTCLEGFTGDGHRCVRIDPCFGVNCQRDATCVPDPTLLCVCNPGFTQDGPDRCVEVATACDPPCPVAEGMGVRCIMVEEGENYCASAATESLLNALSVLLANPAQDPGLTNFTTMLETAARDVAYPGDIPVLINVLVQSLDIRSAGSGLSRESYENLISASSELLDPNKHSIWLQLNESDVSVEVAKLLTGLENLGQQLFLQTNASTRVVISADNVGVAVIRPDCNRTGNISVDSSIVDGNSEDIVPDSAITLPPTVFGMANCTNVGVVVVIYDGIGPLLSGDELLPACVQPTTALVHGRCSWNPAPPDGCSNRTVDGTVLTATAVSAVNDSNVARLNTSMLLHPVRITFQHQDTGTNPTCAFLNEQRVQLAEETWLTERCTVVANESSQEHTVCECYHLTSFALLLSPTGTVTENQPIQIVSKIGLCLSILCLLLTIVLLFTLKLETKQLHGIHRQLAIALCLAQILFLVGVDKTLVPSPDAVCTTIAVLLHYFFLCTFSWQLVEGVHLYLFIVKVFYNEKLVWLYYPLAWGLPAIVVAITLGVRFCNYGSEHYCWITAGEGTNWAFHGPVIAVLVVNFIIMVLVAAVIVRAARKKEQPDTCLVCTLLHASFVLVPILGISWALGFFVVGDSTISRVIEWLFCIFTTLQGLMIFLMHCVLNREVRKAFLNAIGCREAAKKQQTMQNMRLTGMAYIRRKSSTASALQADLRKLQSSRGPDLSGLKHFPKKSRKKKGFWENSESEPALSANFSTARPSITLELEPPGVTMPKITEEDGYSLPNSVPNTPELTHRDTDRLTG